MRVVQGLAGPWKGASVMDAEESQEGANVRQSANQSQDEGARSGASGNSRIAEALDVLVREQARAAPSEQALTDRHIPA